MKSEQSERGDGALSEKPGAYSPTEFLKIGGPPFCLVLKWAPKRKPPISYGPRVREASWKAADAEDTLLQELTRRSLGRASLCSISFSNARGLPRPLRTK